MAQGRPRFMIVEQARVCKVCKCLDVSRALRIWARKLHLFHAMNDLVVFDVDHGVCSCRGDDGLPLLAEDHDPYLETHG